MKSLDANVILRFVLNDIPAQTSKAKSVIARSTCYVTDVVVTETVYVLEKVVGMQRAEIARLLKRFLALRNVTYNDHFLDDVINLYSRRKSLSFVDCYAAIEALTFGNSVVTFDKDLLKHGGRHISEP